MFLTLERTYFPEQTLGKLFAVTDKDIFRCRTLELPWLDNEPWISCIPEGVYNVSVLQESPKFNYPHLLIHNVPRRTDIKIHRGNFKRDITGCILVGKNFIDIDSDGLVDVTHSTDTLSKMMFMIPKAGCKLWIKS
jgi:hypothetical protein